MYIVLITLLPTNWFNMVANRVVTTDLPKQEIIIMYGFVICLWFPRTFKSKSGARKVQNDIEKIEL